MKRYFNHGLILLATTSLLIAIVGLFYNSTSRKELNLLNALGSLPARAEQAFKASHNSDWDTWPSNLFLLDKTGNVQRWGNNSTPVALYQNAAKQFQHLGNGIYYAKQKTIENGDKLLYLEKLQDEFPVTNRYFSKNIQSDYSLSLSKQFAYLSFSIDQQNLYYKIHSDQGNVWFLLMLLSIVLFAYWYKQQNFAKPGYYIAVWLILAFASWLCEDSLDVFSLFSPNYYASSNFNSSLAQLLINVVLLNAFVDSLLFFLAKSSKLDRVKSGILQVVFICYSYVFTLLLRNLISDSKINFEVFNYNALNEFDLLAQLILLIASLIFLKLAVELSANFKKIHLATIITLVLINVVAYYNRQVDLIEINWFVAVLVLCWARTKLSWEMLHWKYLFTCLILVFGINFILNKHLNYRSYRLQSFLAEKLANEEDPIAEYLLEENLPVLETQFLKDSIADTLGFLSSNLLSGYLSRYDIEPLRTKPERQLSVAFLGKNYLLKNKSNKVGFGFPQLFASKNFVTDLPINTSTAVYYKGVLKSQNGYYNFKRKLSDERQRTLNSYGRYSEQNYNFGDSLVLIKTSNKTWIQKFAFVVYLFFISQLALALVLIKQLSKAKHLSLRNKIQFSFASLVVVTVVTFAVLSHYYINEEVANKNKTNLTEKSNSVIVELSQKLKQESDLKLAQPRSLEVLLKKFSAVFFTDINLFDTSGVLLASSQPTLFQKNLLSTLMSPPAFEAMALRASEGRVFEEKIGELNYLSAYKPFYNQEGKLLGFVNLPYFAKQGELDEQLSGFLLSLISALVLLLALALVFAIVLSEQITKPLSDLQEKLQNIDLKTHEKIDYRSYDEIGDLVNAYNTKVSELIKNAEQLAKNERELAWREMAKQVAHEIKNPLTPIKLGAQHLQRSIQIDQPEAKARLDNFINSLLAQVDTLSNIANEFSNYAQLPKAQAGQLELNALLKEACSIFQEQEEIVIETNLLNKQVHVNADSNLLLRVFTNLIKNAVQAIEAKQAANGKICISLVQQDNMLVVSISDNGIGIDDNQRERIFSPNFTTKSSGMGLGLAMVKQIITQAEGDISFESKEGLGTTFTVILPCVD